MPLATYTIAPSLAQFLGQTVTVDCPTPRACTKGWDIRVRPDSRAAILATVATMLAQLPIQGSLDDNGQPQAAHPARQILTDALAGNKLALATIATAGVEAYARPALAFRMISEGDEGGHGGMPRHAQVVRMAVTLAKGLEEADRLAWEACQPADTGKAAPFPTAGKPVTRAMAGLDALHDCGGGFNGPTSIPTLQAAPAAPPKAKRKAKSKATA